MSGEITPTHAGAWDAALARLAADLGTIRAAVAAEPPDPSGHPLLDPADLDRVTVAEAVHVIRQTLQDGRFRTSEGRRAVARVIADQLTNGQREAVKVRLGVHQLSGRKRERVEEIAARARALPAGYGLTPRPAATDGGPATPPEPHPPQPDAGEPHTEPDGLFEPFEFRSAGRTIDFADAALRFRLVSSLWDSAAGRPHPSRQIGEVMGELWPDDDEADVAFKDLCKQVRREFDRAGLPLTVRTAAGKVWLARRQD
jgi:hypothetical protein